MQRSEVLEFVRTRLKREPGVVTETAQFNSDLGLDSIEALELVGSIEEKFGVPIPLEEVDKMATLGDLLDYLDQRIAA